MGSVRIIKLVRRIPSLNGIGCTITMNGCLEPTKVTD